MAVTVNSGLVDTADPASNELKFDMRDKLTYLDPDTTQFTTMLMKISKDKAKSYKVEWWEDQLLPRASALAASAASDVTALTVTTNEGSYFNVGDIVRNVTTGEAMRVTATAASALTVVRGVGAVTAASSASSGTAGQLVIVGGSNAQGATLPTAIITERVLSYNYTSIQRDSFRFVETVIASDYYTGNQFELERYKKAISGGWQFSFSLN